MLSFTGFPDSILTVLVITRLTTSQPETGPLHPATVTGRKAHNDRPAKVKPGHRAPEENSAARRAVQGRVTVTAEALRTGWSRAICTWDSFRRTR
jgi:hypothetical protein